MEPEFKGWPIVLGIMAALCVGVGVLVYAFDDGSHPPAPKPFAGEAE